MYNTENALNEGDKNPFITGLLGFLIALFGFIFLGPLIGSVFALPFMENGLNDLLEFTQNPTGSESYKVPLFIIQGFTTLIGLVIMPWLFLYIRRDRPSKSMFRGKPELMDYALTTAVVITFMGVNAYFIDWNSNVSFPDSLKWLEEWARSSEDKLAEATEFLTTFSTPGQFILGLIVIAVLPAIGEEIVFRGVVQRKLIEGGLNAHISIWFAAILFSAIHVQFFGFVPRMLLGALFGYLYYWSKDLRLAILAHFVNNGFMVGMVYANQTGMIEYDIENSESPTLVSLIIFAIITAGILFLLRRNLSRNSSNERLEGSL